VEQTKEFVLNIISEWFVEAANHCSGAYDSDIDEMALAGLTPIPSVLVKPPRVAESAIQLECVLLHSYPIIKAGKLCGTVLVGEVKLAHVNKGIYRREEGQNGVKHVIDIEKLRPISRLGGDSYGRTVSIFDIKRPEKEAQDRQRKPQDTK